MARIIYSEEFRIEAVNQVIKNGYSVTDTANRLIPYVFGLKNLNLQKQ